MGDSSPASIYIPAKVTAAFIRDSLEAGGVSTDDAAKIAELITEADLTGADGHGLFRLPHYMRRLLAGGINPKPHIQVTKTARATALVDGDNGFGHLVMACAAETAIELARETGIAWVGVRRSNHAGPAGIYAAMPVACGMIGIYSVVASANHMAPWGAAETLLGTNPLAIGIPARNEAPVVLDMSATVVSYGTIKTHRMQGQALPEGWLVDRKDGRPITDPELSADGMLLPIGGYKGSGLALALGLLAGPLNGAVFGRDVIDFNADSTSETNTGHFIIALDIARFTPLKTFTAEVDRHLMELHNSKRMPGVETIRLPGERRHRCREERARDGVPVPAPLLGQLDQLAEQLGINRLSGRAA